MVNITLTLDDDDLRAITAAIEQRQKFLLPDSDSDKNGCVLSQICRAWTDRSAKDDKTLKLAAEALRTWDEWADADGWDNDEYDVFCTAMGDMAKGIGYISAE